MTQEEIIEGNKIIDNFYKSSGQHVSIVCRPSQMEYHSSWDWLMPIVDKIESIYDDHHGYFGVHIISNSCMIRGTFLHKAIKKNSKYGWVYMSDPEAIFETKIESTWYNVVQFIKWWNGRKDRIDKGKLSEDKGNAPVS